MSRQKPSPSFSFFRSLPEARQRMLSEVSRWRWIASIQPRRVATINDPAHRQWIAGKGHLHSPAHREIMLTLSGNGVRTVAGKAYVQKPGSVFLFDYYESRDWKSDPARRQGPKLVLWLHLLSPRPTLTYNTVFHDEKGRQSREIPRRVLVHEAITPLMEAWDRCKALPGDVMQWELCKSLATTVLLEVLRVAEVTTKESSAHQREVIELARQYILDHLAEDLRLETLARITGYSPFFFHRLFREQTGITPKAFVDRERLKRAQELLAQGYTVAAVAESVGSATPYAFSHFFKRQTGCAPGQWRTV
ncbi:MAG TPA: AraC family transcriptional regulator [Chthoniobacteraceae bacterium]|nr:AraC family transcriptional regulator [Chthoniobacteraceae bacterium]